MYLPKPKKSQEAKDLRLTVEVIPGTKPGSRVRLRNTVERTAAHMQSSQVFQDGHDFLYESIFLYVYLEQNPLKQKALKNDQIQTELLFG